MTGAAHRPPIAPPPGEVPRRALVLAGGGMRVAYQAGAVKALHDAGLRFDHADGASGGTMNLAALLSGVAPDELCARWRALRVTDFAALRPPADYLRPGRLAALGSTRGLADKVYPALGIALPRLRAAEGIAASFNVCRFDDKTVQALPQQALDLPRLLAAVSLPVLMPAVQADGATWTDAVWIQDANLLACVERGARELWLVWCIGNTPDWQPGAFRQYVHMIEMSAIGALNRELATIAELNARIAAGEQPWGHDRAIVVHIIQPERPLPLDTDFFAGRIDAATLIDLGYRDARRALREGRPSPLDATATLMSTPRTGISFRETMTGGFALDATDPRVGEVSDDALALHATIHIPDLAAFIADPQHLAGLSGHVDFAPLGLAMPGESGRFGLFTPSGNDPRLVYMIYELGFRQGGQDWYLAGKKHVRCGPPWRLWGETTALYTTLHRGRDASGPVAGAGVLHLGVVELLRLLSTLHATDAPGGLAAAGAVGRFFRFFSAELARTYLLQRPLPATEALR